MKNTRIVILYYKLSFLILFLLLKSALLLATEDVIYNLKFKQLSAPYFLPTNEVQKVYQDKDGFIWFATRNGLCQYNGYETTLYKSNLYSPVLLSITFSPSDVPIQRLLLLSSTKQVMLLVVNKSGE